LALLEQPKSLGFASTYNVAQLRLGTIIPFASELQEQSGVKRAGVTLCGSMMSEPIENQLMECRKRRRLRSI